MKATIDLVGSSSEDEDEEEINDKDNDNGNSDDNRQGDTHMSALEFGHDFRPNYQRSCFRAPIS